MSGLRTGRRKYYDLFSHFYDAFIRLHARRDEDDTRHFLGDAAHLENEPTGPMPSLCRKLAEVQISIRYLHFLAISCLGKISKGFDYQINTSMNSDSGQERDMASNLQFWHFKSDHNIL
jgi:hypothetical protein